MKTASPPNPQFLADIFNQCGITLTARQVEQLWTYHGLLRRHNSDLNLTRIHNFTNMVLKLYVDSILPATLIELPSPLMDLGTGPGMPGIPLKIFKPEVSLMLAEGRGKRVTFLQEVIETLGLSDVEVIDRNITADFTSPVAGVITRAVETIDKTLDRISGCLNQAGKIIFMKGPGCDQEIVDAAQTVEARFRMIQDLPYRIGETSHERRLVVFERLDQPPAVKARLAARRHRITGITAEQNDHFKGLKKLLSGRGLKKSDQALLSGDRLVTEMLARDPDRCLAWITSGDQPPPPPEAPAAMEWLQMAPPLFDTLDTLGTHSPILLIRQAPIPLWQPDEKFPPGCTVLIPFQDPENVGAVIRSAAAFGAAQVLLLAESAHPYHPKALRTSAGAVDLLTLRRGPSLADLPADLPVIALSAEGRDMSTAPFPQAFGLLVGMEGPGLPDQWRTNAVRIPIDGDVESLNAATAAAIALYEWRQRQRTATIDV